MINSIGDFMIESKIVTTMEDKALIKEWINKPYEDVKLVLLGSRDGFKKDTFYNNCCEKGPLLIIVRSFIHN